MKIIRLWSPPRRPVEPTSANCVAGHPVNSQESTLLWSVFAGFQRRVGKIAPIAARASGGSYSVSITGQASPDGGTASYNLRLSALRAQAVQRRLITLGLATHQIAQVKGIGTAGQSCTAHGTLDETKCAQLRRVVITLSPANAAS